MTRTGEREICSVSGRLPDNPGELARMMVTLSGWKDKRFQFFVIIILFQATLFCGRTKAFRLFCIPIARYVYALWLPWQGRYNNYHKVFYRYSLLSFSACS